LPQDKVCGVGYLRLRILKPNSKGWDGLPGLRSPPGESTNCLESYFRVSVFQSLDQNLQDLLGPQTTQAEKGDGGPTDIPVGVMCARPKDWYGRGSLLKLDDGGPGDAPALAMLAQDIAPIAQGLTLVIRLSGEQLSKGLDWLKKNDQWRAAKEKYAEEVKPNPTLPHDSPPLSTLGPQVICTRPAGPSAK
jgi:hypothetical protein